jgi:hypothetical protein
MTSEGPLQRPWNAAATLFSVVAAPVSLLDIYLLVGSSPPTWVADYVFAAPLAGLALSVLFLLPAPAVLRTSLGGLVFGLLFATFAALPRVFLTHVLDWRPVAISGVVVGLAAFVGIYLRTRATGARSPLTAGFAGLAFIGLWGAFAYLHLNAVLDHTPASTFRVQIRNAEVRSHLRGPADYRITLAPWGPFSGSQGQNVSTAVYRQLAIQAEACVSLHSGAFDTAWFELNPCADAIPKT